MNGLLAGVMAAQMLTPLPVETPVQKCLSGQHELGRVWRLPITPMTAAKPRNPHEDAYPPCREQDEEVG